MTRLADADGFNIFIRVCVWPRFPPLLLISYISDHFITRYNGNWHQYLGNLTESLDTLNVINRIITVDTIKTLVTLRDAMNFFLTSGDHVVVLNLHLLTQVLRTRIVGDLAGRLTPTTFKVCSLQNFYSMTGCAMNRKLQTHFNFNSNDIFLKKITETHE